jgi:uncharacterized protein YjiS (DUF1127 family)
MTYTIQTDRAVAGTPIWQRLSDLIAGFSHRQAQHRAYHSTVRELTALSNRDLTDMGIDQADIHTIARQAAYGA